MNFIIKHEQDTEGHFIYIETFDNLNNISLFSIDHTGFNPHWYYKYDFQEDFVIGVDEL